MTEALNLRPLWVWPNLSEVRLCWASTFCFVLMSFENFPRLSIAQLHSFILFACSLKTWELASLKQGPPFAGLSSCAKHFTYILFIQKTKMVVRCKYLLFTNE